MLGWLMNLGLAGGGVAEITTYYRDSATFAVRIEDAATFAQPATQSTTFAVGISGNVTFG